MVLEIAIKKGFCNFFKRDDYTENCFIEAPLYELKNEQTNTKYYLCENCSSKAKKEFEAENKISFTEKLKNFSVKNRPDIKPVILAKPIEKKYKEDNEIEYNYEPKKIEWSKSKNPFIIKKETKITSPAEQKVKPEKLPKLKKEKVIKVKPVKEVKVKKEKIIAGKIYSKAQKQFLFDYAGTMSWEELSKKFLETFNKHRPAEALKTKATRLKVGLRDKAKGTEYKTQSEFIKEATSFQGIKRDTVVGLIYDKFIPVIAHNKSLKLISLEDYELCIEFFRDYIPLHISLLEIPDKYKESFEEYCKKKYFDVIEVPNRVTFRFWVKRTEIDVYLDLINNYYGVNEYAKKINKSYYFVSNLIKNGKLEFKKFGYKYFIPKSYIEFFETKQEVETIVKQEFCLETEEKNIKNSLSILKNQIKTLESEFSNLLDKYTSIKIQQSKCKCSSCVGECNQCDFYFLKGLAKCLYCGKSKSEIRNLVNI